MTTYATLKSDVAAWSARGDLTSVIPSFIRMAESEIFKVHAAPLRVREMESEATISDLTVPSDFLDGRYIKDSRKTLFYMPPDEWNTDKYGHFTIVGTTIKIPTGTSGDLTLGYYSTPDALAEDADTNAILQGYYTIFLKAALKHAKAYVYDAEGEAKLQNELNGLLSAANGRNKSAIGARVVRAA